MKITLDRLSKELENMLNDYLKQNLEERQKALMEGAKFLKSELEKAAPVRTGDYRNSFVIEDKFSDHIYVGNIKHVKGRSGNSLPLSNILEFNGHAHIRPTYDKCKNQMYEIIKKNLGGK